MTFVFRPFLHKTIKYIVFGCVFLLFLTFANTSMAQEEVNRPTSGVYLSSLHNISKVDGVRGWNMDIEGGLKINRLIFGGYGSTIRFGEKTYNNLNYKYNINHGGFFIGGEWRSRKVIQPFFLVRAGMGRVLFYERGRSGRVAFQNRITAVTPTTGVQFKLTPWLHSGLAGGYRLILDNQSFEPVVNADNFSGWFLQMSIRVGFYTKNKKSKPSASDRRIYQG